MRRSYRRPDVSSRKGIVPEDRYRFHVRGVGPIDGIFDDDAEEFLLLRHMARQAEDYLQEFTWCKSIREGYFGGGYGGIVAVFFFRIVPGSPKVEEWLWVIVGDLPPAWLPVDNSKTPSEALENYLWEMTRWVHFAKRGLAPEDGFPVDLPPTWKNAEQLEDKLKILRKAIVPAFQAREALQT
jgi:hypothetical protein